MAWKRERSLHIDGKEWKYKIGGHVAIRSPEGETSFVGRWDFMKIMALKLTLDKDGHPVAEIHPSDVQRYIERHILKKARKGKKKGKKDGSQRMAEVPMRDSRGQGGGAADLPRA